MNMNDAPAFELPPVEYYVSGAYIEPGISPEEQIEKGKTKKKKEQNDESPQFLFSQH